jgi:hypothetical protein
MTSLLAVKIRPSANSIPVATLDEEIMTRRAIGEVIQLLLPMSMQHWLLHLDLDFEIPLYLPF